MQGCCRCWRYQGEHCWGRLQIPSFSRAASTQPAAHPGHCKPDQPQVCHRCCRFSRHHQL